MEEAVASDERFLRRWAIVRLKGIGGCGDVNPQIANSRRRSFTEGEIQQEMDELRFLLAKRSQASKG